MHAFLSLFILVNGYFLYGLLKSQTSIIFLHTPQSINTRYTSQGSWNLTTSIDFGFQAQFFYYSYILSLTITLTAISLNESHL